MTHQQAARIVGILVAAYPSPAWPRETIALYCEDLLDCDYEWTIDATTRWRRTHDERPAISQLRGAIVGDFAGPETAWGELHAAIQHSEQQPAFSSPLIAAALRLTGRSWQDLRYLQYEEYPWLKRDFTAAYREAHDRAVALSQQAPGARLTLPTQPEAKLLLETVQAATGKPVMRPVPAVGAARDAARQIAEVCKPAPLQEQTPEQLEKRRVQLRRQLARVTEGEVAT